jgi:hypothetical protein
MLEDIRERLCVNTFLTCFRRVNVNLLSLVLLRNTLPACIQGTNIGECLRECLLIPRLGQLSVATALRRRMLVPHSGQPRSSIMPGIIFGKFGESGDRRGWVFLFWQRGG